jgi:sulfate transport system substrate-binding protein
VVYDEVIPASAPRAGQGARFSESFGASGIRAARRVGPAGRHRRLLARARHDAPRSRPGLVADDWASTPTKGFVSKSVVSFIVRKGNPKRIHTWDDLLKPGVKVLTPNPFTSGAAKWNILAAYGAKSGGGENAQAGLDYLRELITKHVVVQDKSAARRCRTSRAAPATS